MTRSEWTCNACGLGFTTKGKRDNHRERAHRQGVVIGVENQGVERSGNGKFICNCGRDYMLAPSLRRHQRKCKTRISVEEERNTDDEDDGGI